MTLKKRIAARIRELRKEKNLTREKVAHYGDLGKGFITELEQGKWNPSVSTLQKIARALEIPLWALLVFPKQSKLDRAADTLRKASPEKQEEVERLLTQTG